MFPVATFDSPSVPWDERRLLRPRPSPLPDPPPTGPREPSAPLRGDVDVAVPAEAPNPLREALASPAGAQQPRRGDLAAANAGASTKPDRPGLGEPRPTHAEGPRPAATSTEGAGQAEQRAPDARAPTADKGAPAKRGPAEAAPREPAEAAPREPAEARARGDAAPREPAEARARGDAAPREPAEPRARGDAAASEASPRGPRRARPAPDRPKARAPARRAAGDGAEGRADATPRDAQAAPRRGAPRGAPASSEAVTVRDVEAPAAAKIKAPRGADASSEATTVRDVETPRAAQVKAPRGAQASSEAVTVRDVDAPTGSAQVKEPHAVRSGSEALTVREAEVPVRGARGALRPKLGAWGRVGLAATSPVAAVGGMYFGIRQAGSGIERIRRGETVDGTLDLVEGASSAGAGAAFAVGQPGVGLRLAATASMAGGARDVRRGLIEGDTEKLALGTVKIAGGAGLASNHPALQIGGAVVTGGALVYENREYLAEKGAEAGTWARTQADRAVKAATPHVEAAAAEVRPAVEELREAATSPELREAVEGAVKDAVAAVTAPVKPIVDGVVHAAEAADAALTAVRDGLESLWGSSEDAPKKPAE